ncbi:unnamed protein product [Gongylonema pulchrum]|uniref:PIPK domain-containing protein n=1 Tax=Gongylonema pulchrum TaxID=637853 RepID=A0A183DAM5_9BILA|nr:unnamed protein product [Gongylonema pulchrum]
MILAVFRTKILHFDIAPLLACLKSESFKELLYSEDRGEIAFKERVILTGRNAYYYTLRSEMNFDEFDSLYERMKTNHLVCSVFLVLYCLYYCAIFFGCLWR